MSLFSNSTNSDRYGVIIDIGSGSVLSAIVHSNHKENHPNIIWSHREQTPLRNIEDIEDVIKAINTSLLNSVMLLDGEGRKALYEYDKSAKITHLQCGISAPWSYTVTKTINYKQDNPFPISDQLFDDLFTTIKRKIEQDLKENKLVQDFGLSMITRSTMSILSNGYRVANPKGQLAKELTISQATVVTQKHLDDSLNDIQKKLFPKADIHKLSFILILYNTARQLLVNNFDLTLVDITYEATEIGIVRDGVLVYSTHTPFGLVSLAREISAVTNSPLHESLGLLKTEKPYAFVNKLTDKQQTEVSAIFDAYIIKIKELFHETGDELSIPKTILIHTDLHTESLFADLIRKAAKGAIKSEPEVTPVTKMIINKTYSDSTKKTTKYIEADTALLLSANFFHNQDQESNIEYL